MGPIVGCPFVPGSRATRLLVLGAFARQASLVSRRELVDNRRCRACPICVGPGLGKEEIGARASPVCPHSVFFHSACHRDGAGLVRLSVSPSQPLRRRSSRPPSQDRVGRVVVVRYAVHQACQAADHDLPKRQCWQRLGDVLWSTIPGVFQVHHRCSMRHYRHGVLCIQLLWFDDSSIWHRRSDLVLFYHRVSRRLCCVFASVGYHAGHRQEYQRSGPVLGQGVTGITGQRPNTVKTRWRYGTSRRSLNNSSYQAYARATPQDEQKRVLPLCGIRRTFPHGSHMYTWHPRLRGRTESIH